MRGLRNLLILMLVFGCFSQLELFGQRYQLKDGRKAEKIKFELLNNLMIIPMEVNGVALSFVLDSGVNKPILFNLADQDSVQLNNVSEVSINGLGEGEAVNALRSHGNRFRLGTIENASQELFVVMDAAINFSPTLGIPVHGIIGFDLFRDFVVEIDYGKRFLKFYDPKAYSYKRNANSESFDISLVHNKAYLNAKVGLENDETVAVKMLLDTGSSDAIWLFENDSIVLPSNNYEDFLGKGLAGDVYGKRTRISHIQIGSFVLKDAKAAFPNMSVFGAITDLGDRNGTLGGALLKRFNIVFDYPNERISLKKNRNFKLPFQFNISGINLQHAGVRYISERIMNVTENTEYGNVQIMMAGATRLSLVPEIVVSGIRVGSPAYSAGLKEGDVILAVNGKRVHRYKLQEILQMLNKGKHESVKVRVSRLNRDLIFSLKLKELFK
ncbi:aspartyl protease family protein [Maribacter chungangensis]|uniref:Aspartyl protease family protein n=1 Tax=Maribacter chungangensis TaxID=1069117 RepID=A0ABW3B4A4_9FLAO